MADITLKRGDTFPSIRGRVADTAGTLAINTADYSLLLLRQQGGTVLISGTVTVIDPDANDGNNWEYEWAEGDTDEVGTYDMEVEIHWDDGASPPEVQTVPNTGYGEMVIELDLDPEDNP